MYQISSANNIIYMGIYKNKYETIAYKNYNNSQINTDVNTIDSKLWDIVRVLKCKSKSKSMALLITKHSENCAERTPSKWKINLVQNKLLW